MKAVNLRTFWLFPLALAVGVLTALVFASKGDDRVALCHHGGGGRAGSSLVVARSAVPAHLGHGDELGSCRVSPSR